MPYSIHTDNADMSKQYPSVTQPKTGPFCNLMLQLNSSFTSFYSPIKRTINFSIILSRCKQDDHESDFLMASFCFLCFRRLPVIKVDVVGNCMLSYASEGNLIKLLFWKYRSCVGLLYTVMCIELEELAVWCTSEGTKFDRCITK